MNESKVDNYVERMQQPLISDSVKENFKKFILDHTINYGKVLRKQLLKQLHKSPHKPLYTKKPQNNSWGNY